MMKLNAATRLLADEAPVIAPSDSYKHENENDLKNRQSDREHDTDNTSSEEHKEEGSAEESEWPGAIDDETEIHDTHASSTHSAEEPTIDADDAEYAIHAHVRLLADTLNTESDPLTQDMEDACVADSTVDGIVPNTEEGFPLKGDDVDENYMNVRGELDAASRLSADADPKLFDLAEQPLG
jgi:hypothetical protein